MSVSLRLSFFHQMLLSDNWDMLTRFFFSKRNGGSTDVNRCHSLSQTRLKGLYADYLFQDLLNLINNQVKHVATQQRTEQWWDAEHSGARARKRQHLCPLPGKITACKNVNERTGSRANAQLSWAQLSSWSRPIWPQTHAHTLKLTSGRCNRLSCVEFWEEASLSEEKRRRTP